jgi:DNA invertase Pin-like site-specific DNA recombinase
LQKKVALYARVSTTEQAEEGSLKFLKDSNCRFAELTEGSTCSFSDL